MPEGVYRVNAAPLQVKDLFLESYAKKHAGSSLAANGVHVRSADGRALPDASVTRAFVNEHDAVTIVLGAAPERVGPPTLPPPPSTSGVATGGTGDAGAGTGLVPCRNFGCQARFQPAPAGNDASSSAAASACRHHMGPPMFRDGACEALAPRAVVTLSFSSGRLRGRGARWRCRPLYSTLTGGRSDVSCMRAPNIYNEQHPSFPPLLPHTRREEGVVLLSDARRVRVGRLPCDPGLRRCVIGGRRTFSLNVCGRRDANGTSLCRAQRFRTLRHPTLPRPCSWRAHRCCAANHLRGIADGHSSRRRGRR